MNIALLFNSEEPKFKGCYGYPIRRNVFGLGILQASQRHMKVAVGDVAIYSHSSAWGEYDQLTERAYFGGRWSLFHERRLRVTFRKATVYAPIFENMTQEIARKLHEALGSEISS